MPMSVLEAKGSAPFNSRGKDSVFSRAFHDKCEASAFKENRIKKGNILQISVVIFLLAHPHCLKQ